MSLIVTSWSDVIAIYPELGTLKNATSPEQHSILLSRAEGYVHGRLASKFTTPFSSNNYTARDLVFDTLYVQNIMFNQPAKGKVAKDALEAKFNMLLDGKMQMMDVSGTVCSVPAGEPAWSSTKDYHPVFGMGAIENAAVSSSQLIDEDTARGGDGVAG